VLHAADIGIGLARAIRAAVFGAFRGGVLILICRPSFFSQVMKRGTRGAKSLVQGDRPGTGPDPSPEARSQARGLDVLKKRKASP